MPPFFRWRCGARALHSTLSYQTGYKGSVDILVIFSILKEGAEVCHDDQASAVWMRIIYNLAIEAYAGVLVASRRPATDEVEAVVRHERWSVLVLIRMKVVEVWLAIEGEGDELPERLVPLSRSLMLCKPRYVPQRQVKDRGDGRAEAVAVWAELVLIDFMHTKLSFRIRFL